MLKKSEKCRKNTPEIRKNYETQKNTRKLEKILQKSREKIPVRPKKGPHFILVEESGTNTLDKFGTKLEKYTPKTVAIKQMKIYIISMKPIEKSQHIVNNCNNCSVFIVWL